MAVRYTREFGRFLGEHACLSEIMWLEARDDYRSVPWSKPLVKISKWIYLQKARLMAQNSMQMYNEYLDETSKVFLEDSRKA